MNDRSAWIFGRVVPGGLMALAALFAVLEVVQLGILLDVFDGSALRPADRSAALGRSNLLILAASLCMGGSAAFFFCFGPERGLAALARGRRRLWSAASILLIGGVALLWASVRIFSMRSLMDATSLDLGALAATSVFIGLGFIVVAGLLFRSGSGRERSGHDR